MLPSACFWAYDDGVVYQHQAIDRKTSFSMLTPNPATQTRVLCRNKKILNPEAGGGAFRLGEIEGWQVIAQRTSGTTPINPDQSSKLYSASYDIDLNTVHINEGNEIGCWSRREAPDTRQNERKITVKSQFFNTSTNQWQDWPYVVNEEKDFSCLLTPLTAADGFKDGNGVPITDTNNDPNWVLRGLKCTNEGKDASGNFIWAPEITYNVEWEWYPDPANASNNSGYFSFWGANIPSPFGVGNSVGVPVEAQQHTQEEGWRLYIRRMYCKHMLTDCGVGASAPADMKYPFFALYNIHTGILRTFIYLNGDLSSYQWLTTESSIVGVGGKDTTATGLFLNSGDMAYSQQDKARNLDDGYTYSLPEDAYTGRWLVVDNEIAYDPAVMEGGAAFQIGLIGHEQSDITLNGSLDFTLVSTTPSAYNKQISEFSAMKKLGADVKERFYDGTQAGEKLADLSQGLLASDKSWQADVGASLSNAAYLLDGASSILGFVNAAPALISGVKSIFGGGKSKPKEPTIQYGSGSVELSGNILDEDRVRTLQFGVLHAEAEDFAKTPDLKNFPKNLGLYSWKRRPRFSLYSISGCADHSDSLLLNDQDYSSLIDVNPASGMKLVDIRLATAVLDIRKPNSGGILGTEAMSGQANAYDYAHPVMAISELELFPVGNVPGIGGGFWYDSVWNPQILLTDSPSHRGDVLSEKLKLRVYLKFQHKTQSDKYYEVMQEVAYDVTSLDGFGVCTPMPF